MTNKRLGAVFGSEEPWQQRALCAKAPELVRAQFTRDDYNIRFDKNNVFFNKAVALCRRCPVRKECRDWNDKMERYSVIPVMLTSLFAGETPRMRAARRLRKRRSKEEI